MKSLALLLLLMPLRLLSEKANPLDSVVLLYSQGEDGGMAMHCTATAYEHSGKAYKFLTAAHCVTKNSTTPGKLELRREPMFVSPDDSSSEKSFSRATIEKVGRAEEGYDFALLTAELPNEIPVTPLGDETKEQGGVEVVNVAAPLGLGRVLFHGYVSLLKIDRPLYDEDEHINWQGSMLVQLPAEGGSSGSAVVSKDTGKVIAIVVGTMKKLTIAIPISRVGTTEQKFLLYPAAAK